MSRKVLERAEFRDTDKFNTRVNFKMLVKRDKKMCRRKVRDEAEPKAKTWTGIYLNSKVKLSKFNQSHHT